jgi:hypothetical protein
MNERIKQLAARSNFGHMENGEVVYDHRLEKFAELVVRECAKRSEELGQPELGKGLMKHFGVEQ